MIKFLLDNSPIITFFISYKVSGHDIIFSTSAMLIATIIMLLIYHLWKIKIPVMTYVSTGILLLLGSITIFSGDSRFIKLKPTIVNFIFAIVLLIGVYKKVGLIKYVFNGQLEMEENNWRTLSCRFAIFFISMGIVNEYIWRNFDESFWVNFKLFGFSGLTICFFISQIPFIIKHRLQQ